MGEKCTPPHVVVVCIKVRMETTCQQHAQQHGVDTYVVKYLKLATALTPTTTPNITNLGQALTKIYCYSCTKWEKHCFQWYI